MVTRKKHVTEIRDRTRIMREQSSKSTRSLKYIFKGSRRGVVREIVRNVCRVGPRGRKTYLFFTRLGNNKRPFHASPPQVLYPIYIYIKVSI